MNNIVMILGYDDIIQKGDYYREKNTQSDLDWIRLNDDWPRIGMAVKNYEFCQTYEFARPVKLFYPEKLVEF